MGEGGQVGVGEKGTFEPSQEGGKVLAASHLLHPQACFVLNFFPQVFHLILLSNDPLCGF